MIWKKYLGILIMAVAYTGLAMIAGWALRGESVQKQIIKIESQAKTASDRVLPALTGEMVKLAADKAVINEGLKNVSDTPACHLSRGDISLLNRARTGLPDATALTDEKERAAAALTQRDEISAHADCGLRYRALAAEHDALIDWLVLSGGK